jgi:hypothetical protein
MKKNSVQKQSPGQISNALERNGEKGGEAPIEAGNQALMPMPNIDKIGSGYDILFGNPHAIGTIDPGFRDAVYNLTLYNGQLTPDRRFLLPDGAQVSRCQACALDFVSTQVSTAEEYQNTLKTAVKASFNSWRGAFSASRDYKRVVSGTTNSSERFTKSTAVCEVYCAQILRFDPPPFSDGFNRAVGQVLSLPYNAANRAAYRRFFEAFGTHVVQEARLGGTFGEQNTFTSSDWSRLREESTNILAEASAAAKLRSVGGSVMREEERKRAEHFSKFVSRREVYTVGGSIPADGSAATWASNAVAEPQAIQYTLVQLDELLTTMNFPRDPNIQAKQNNLRTALAGYCTQLMREGTVSYCRRLTQATRPTNTEFGGMFQEDDCNKNRVPNDRTNDLNCPDGFTSRRAFRVVAPESGCAAWMSYCYNATAQTRRIFGGMFQQREDGTVYAPNPLTGNSTCPPGFLNHTMATGLSPDKRSYVEIVRDRRCRPRCRTYRTAVTRHVDQQDVLSICLPPTASFVRGESIIGGFFQQNEAEAHNNVDNPYTQSRSCPLGYRRVTVGRVRASGGNRTPTTVSICVLQG